MKMLWLNQNKLGENTSQQIIILLKSSCLIEKRQTQITRTYAERKILKDLVTLRFIQKIFQKVLIWDYWTKFLEENKK
jgi:hypothetical protein